eukprot:gene7934-9760_t
MNNNENLINQNGDPSSISTPSTTTTSIATTATNGNDNGHSQDEENNKYYYDGMIVDPLNNTAMEYAVYEDHVNGQTTIVDYDPNHHHLRTSSNGIVTYTQPDIDSIPYPSIVGDRLYMPLAYSDTRKKGEELDYEETLRDYKNYKEKKRTRGYSSREEEEVIAEVAVEVVLAVIIVVIEVKEAVEEVEVTVEAEVIVEAEVTVEVVDRVDLEVIVEVEVIVDREAPQEDIMVEAVGVVIRAEVTVPAVAGVEVEVKEENHQVGSLLRHHRKNHPRNEVAVPQQVGVEVGIDIIAVVAAAVNIVGIEVVAIVEAEVVVEVKEDPHIKVVVEEVAIEDQVEVEAIVEEKVVEDPQENHRDLVLHQDQVESSSSKRDRSRSTDKNSSSKSSSSSSNKKSKSNGTSTSSSSSSSSKSTTTSSSSLSNSTTTNNKNNSNNTRNNNNNINNNKSTSNSTQNGSGSLSTNSNVNSTKRRNYQDNLILVDTFKYFNDVTEYVPSYHYPFSFQELSKTYSYPTHQPTIPYLQIFSQLLTSFQMEYVSREQPDQQLYIKDILQEIRGCVLMDCKLVFSGIFPKQIEPSKLCHTRILKITESFGATIGQDIDESTTHLIFIKEGTSKVQQALKKGIKVVHFAWLRDSIHHWERMDESNYSVSQATQQQQLPQSQQSLVKK